MSGRATLERSAAIEGDGGLYRSDFYAWTRQQAELLKAGRLVEADVANITEEIETLGRSEVSRLRSSYRLILLHLLKMRFQPGKRTGSWRATIVRERNELEQTLADNPGLQPRRAELFARAYVSARREAAAETELAIKLFPEACPFSLEQTEDHGFWPE